MLDADDLEAMNEMVPEHLRAGLRRYIDGHVMPGHFLQACLEHDLQAVVLADPISFEALPEIWRWLYNFAPSACHGSHAKVIEWVMSKEAQAHG